MALSAFSDQAHPPTDGDLRSALGAAHGAWTELISAIRTRVPSMDQFWGFTSRTTGWGLRLRHEEQVILYMTPCRGHFLVSFALGEGVVARARAADLPAPLLSAVEAAPRYAEGRGVRIKVKDAGELPGLVTLAELKFGGGRRKGAAKSVRSAAAPKRPAAKRRQVAKARQGKRTR